MVRRRLLAWFLGWAGVMILLVALGLPCGAQESTRKVVARTAPSYPELAKKMHLTGKVKLDVTINASGTVTSAKLVGGSPVFEKDAVEAVKQWRFEPAPKDTKGVVILEFTDH